VIEDDCYADLVDRATPRLVTLDGLHRVVYVGSFSKTISANLRVGFIAAKADLAEALCTLKVATGLTTSEAVERTIYQFLTMCGHRQSTRRLQGCLRDATMRVSRVMEEEGFELDRSVIGGMFLWARLPWFDDSEELARRCLREGIVLAPGRLFRSNREKSPWLRFNVASLQNAKVLDAILRCAKAP
jgi:DNA-binding transcriptional MocR family regulator